ncbi:hypothetical protein ACKKBG_A20260 [Auxenochlorella protothecoides x Auxenochlorella symbiontica]
MASKVAAKTTRHISREAVQEPEPAATIMAYSEAEATPVPVVMLSKTGGEKEAMVVDPPAAAEMAIPVTKGVGKTPSKAKSSLSRRKRAATSSAARSPKKKEVKKVASWRFTSRIKKAFAGLNKAFRGSHRTYPVKKPRDLKTRSFSLASVTSHLSTSIGGLIHFRSKAI